MSLHMHARILCAFREAGGPGHPYLEHFYSEAVDMGRLALELARTLASEGLANASRRLDSVQGGRIGDC